jgi:hypothetical protein
MTQYFVFRDLRSSKQLITNIIANSGFGIEIGFGLGDLADTMSVNKSPKTISFITPTGLKIVVQPGVVTNPTQQPKRFLLE